jgi:HPt (histidine-containing phosphotransfer) domain-containing protein
VRIRSLQKERNQRPSVVIAFSARDDDAARMQCRRAGFDHYLVKPASREEIFALLRDQADLSPTASEDRAAGEMAALLPQFVASRRPLLQQLCDAAEHGQRDTVRSTAHLLAGSFGMYGFRQAGRLSRQIESNASSQELPWLRERCKDLVQQFERDQVTAKDAVS